ERGGAVDLYGVGGHAPALRAAELDASGLSRRAGPCITFGLCHGHGLWHARPRVPSAWRTHRHRLPYCGLEQGAPLGQAQHDEAASLSWACFSVRSVASWEYFSWTSCSWASLAARSYASLTRRSASSWSRSARIPCG